jgi:hypothetical protein
MRHNDFQRHQPKESPTQRSRETALSGRPGIPLSPRRRPATTFIATNGLRTLTRKPGWSKTRGTSLINLRPHLCVACSLSHQVGQTQLACYLLGLVDDESHEAARRHLYREWKAGGHTQASLQPRRRHTDRRRPHAGRAVPPGGVRGRLDRRPIQERPGHATSSSRAARTTPPRSEGCRGVDEGVDTGRVGVEGETRTARGSSRPPRPAPPGPRAPLDVRRAPPEGTSQRRSCVDGGAALKR